MACGQGAPCSARQCVLHPRILQLHAMHRAACSQSMLNPACCLLNWVAGVMMACLCTHQAELTALLVKYGFLRLARCMQVFLGLLGACRRLVLLFAASLSLDDGGDASVCFCAVVAHRCWHGPCNICCGLHAWCINCLHAWCTTNCLVFLHGLGFCKEAGLARLPLLCFKKLY